MSGFKSGSTGDPYEESANEDDRDVENDMPKQESTTRPSEEEKDERPYVVRRTMAGEPVTWNRDRLTMFVRDEVQDQERELINYVERELGRDVPKFDVREAAYLVALSRQDLVLEEMRRMGYE